MKVLNKEFLHIKHCDDKEYDVHRKRGDKIVVEEFIGDTMTMYLDNAIISYEGCVSLFRHFEKLEKEAGKEFEYDQFLIYALYEEYRDFNHFLEENDPYDYELEEIKCWTNSPSYPHIETMDELRAATDVIDVKDGSWGDEQFIMKHFGRELYRHEQKSLRFIEDKK